MWTTLTLSILGAIMVFSASSIYSLENKGNSFSVIGRQLFFLFISIPLGYLASRQKLDRWKNLARFGFVISAIVLIIVAIAKAMSVNTVASTPPNIFPDTPEIPGKTVKFLQNINALKSIKIINVPNKPSSSPITEKIKSV